MKDNLLITEHVQAMRNSLKQACFAFLALLVATVAGCRAPARAQRERPQLRRIAAIESANRRLPPLLDGLSYRCAKLEVAEDAAERRATFFEMAQDAEEAERLIRPLPAAAGFPGKPGQEVEGLAARALDAADALKQAARARRQDDAGAAMAELRKNAEALLEVIALWRPVISVQPERTG